MIECRTIKELCSVVVDCPHSTPTWTVEGKIVVRSNNIKNGRIDFSSPSYTDDEHFQQRIKRATPQGGDIIITREAPMGEVGMIPEGIVCCLGQRMVLLRANPEICDNYYLLYSLQSRYVQHQISWSEGTGTTVSNLRIPHLEQLKIPYLPLSKQRQVSSVLRCLEGKIEQNRVINDNLQQQLFSLYENMATASPCSKEYTLSNLCDFQEGYVNPPQTHPEYFDGEVKWLRAVDINESFIIETSRTLTKAGFESAKKSALLFEPNTIAISKSGTIGRLGIIADYMCGNRAVINIAPHDTNMLAFIYCFLKSKQREFPDMAVGSVQKNLYVSLLEPLSVSIPDNESLTAFNAVGASILGMIHNNCVENTDLANLRDTILPKLMSGELDVSSVLI